MSKLSPNIVSETLLKLAWEGVRRAAGYLHGRLSTGGTPQPRSSSKKKGARHQRDDMTLGLHRNTRGRNGTGTVNDYHINTVTQVQQPAWLSVSGHPKDIPMFETGDGMRVVGRLYLGTTGQNTSDYGGFYASPPWSYNDTRNLGLHPRKMNSARLEALCTCFQRYAFRMIRIYVIRNSSTAVPAMAMGLLTDPVMRATSDAFAFSKVCELRHSSVFNPQSSSVIEISYDGTDTWYMAAETVDSASIRQNIQYTLACVNQTIAAANQANTCLIMVDYALDVYGWSSTGTLLAPTTPDDPVVGEKPTLVVSEDDVLPRLPASRALLPAAAGGAPRRATNP